MRHDPKLARIGIYASLLVFALFFTTPLYIVVVTSFKGLDELRRGNLLSLPDAWSAAAWAKAWGVACEGLRPFFLNSVKIVIPAVTLSAVIGAVNGYALAQWHFRGAAAIFTL